MDKYLIILQCISVILKVIIVLFLLNAYIRNTNSRLCEKSRSKSTLDYNVESYEIKNNIIIFFDSRNRALGSCDKINLEYELEELGILRCCDKDKTKGNKIFLFDRITGLRYTYIGGMRKFEEL